jgi:CubicO group peptidase (beta-lactamase class C family)
MSTNLPIGGECDARFSRVREAFVENFEKHGERGGAVAISLHGKPVVDLWGGWADVARTRGWERDTIVNVFSVCKALNAIAVLRLAEQGHVALDEPIARLWPEFAANGKEGITVRMLLCHQAGLPALREELPDGAMLDWSRITNALANERPWWEPGTAHGYHVNTFGFLTGEIVRRASGKTIGKFLRDEIWQPLGADMHIGAPATEHHRIAEFRWAGGQPKPEFADDYELMRWNAYWNPAGFSGGIWINTKEWRDAEVPSTNGHANARSIARVYSALAAGGTIDGISVLSKETLQEATREHSSGIDLISQRPIRFGLGFQLTQIERPLGPNPHSFGHFGAGGSLGFCDPDMREFGRPFELLLQHPLQRRREGRALWPRRGRENASGDVQVEGPRRTRSRSYRRGGREDRSFVRNLQGRQDRGRQIRPADGRAHQRD